MWVVYIYVAFRSRFAASCTVRNGTAFTALVCRRLASRTSLCGRWDGRCIAAARATCPLVHARIG